MASVDNIIEWRARVECPICELDTDCTAQFTQDCETVMIDCDICESRFHIQQDM